MYKLRILTLAVAFLLPLVGVVAQGDAGRSSKDADDKTAVIFQQGNDTVIEANVRAQLAAGSTAEVMIYRKNGAGSKRIVDQRSVPDCAAVARPDEVCLARSAPDAIRFVYRSREAPDAGAKYDLAYFITDARRGDIDEILKVAPIIDKDKPDVGEITSSEIRDEFRTTINGHPNGEISIAVQFPAEGRSSADVRQYVDRRIRALYDWLEPKTVEPKGVATVKVEPRTKRIPHNEAYVFQVVAMRLAPSGFNEAVATGEFDIVLVTNRNFPAGKYDLAVAFNNDAPPELKGTLTNSLTGAAMKPADASTAGNDRSYLLRDLKNNLDLALSYTSSIETTKVGNRSTTGRQNNGVVDLRFAPLLDWHKDGDFKNFLTPFFVDVKVSNGKISNKTLSLNRIILGAEYMRRDVMINSRDKNKLVYFFRGLSASDRDFKRAEAKFNFEFRPLFYRLYNPINGDVQAVKSVLIESSPPKILPRHDFGYQIQPFVGAEVGGVYRDLRQAFDVEDTSRTLRRVYFGTDMLFNLTQYANVKLTDTFYYRGESPQHPTRNYFRGEIQAVLFNSPDTSQCIFFSFERGDQPPFSTPSVNALKIGYRITSNLFQRRP